MACGRDLKLVYMIGHLHSRHRSLRGMYLTRASLRRMKRLIGCLDRACVVPFILLEVGGSLRSDAHNWINQSNYIILLPCPIWGTSPL